VIAIRAGHPSSQSGLPLWLHGRNGRQNPLHDSPDRATGGHSCSKCFLGRHGRCDQRLGCPVRGPVSRLNAVRRSPSLHRARVACAWPCIERAACRRRIDIRPPNANSAARSIRRVIHQRLWSRSAGPCTSRGRAQSRSSTSERLSGRMAKNRIARRPSV